MKSTAAEKRRDIADNVRECVFHFYVYFHRHTLHCYGTVRTEDGARVERDVQIRK